VSLFGKTPLELGVDDVTKEEHQAIQQLWRGTATEYQQQLALQVIVNKFARAQDLLYVPGDVHATSFINGRAFVGQQILKYLNVPIGQLHPDEGDTSNV
jgi:hypothetical protein